MKCPYCGTENPEDAQECSNCSADLASLPQGTPPPESTAPTMMTSSAEVAAMLAAAKAEQESDPDDSEPEETSEAVAEAVEEEPSSPPPDYSAPTMMSSSAEVGAMLAAARAEQEAESEAAESEEAAASAEEMPDHDGSDEEVPADVEEGVYDESAFAPTMISSIPDEVAAVVAAAKMSAETQDDVEAELSEEETSLEQSAPTYVGIPDPLGTLEQEPVPPPAEEPEPAPTFKETPTPFFNEPVAPPPAVPPISPETPKKDNNRIWIIGGVSCLALCCLCSLTVLAIRIMMPFLNQ